jgi:hypothetical protein
MNAKQRLALFYLANDVVQNCKRKNARVFQDTFKKHMNEAVKYVRLDMLSLYLNFSKFIIISLSSFL